MLRGMSNIGKKMFHVKAALRQWVSEFILSHINISENLLSNVHEYFSANAFCLPRTDTAIRWRLQLCDNGPRESPPLMKPSKAKKFEEPVS